MFDDHIAIKNEPIDDGDTEYNEDPLINYTNIDHLGNETMAFAADDGSFYESSIVKEEPRLNIVSPIEDISTACGKESDRTFECYICKCVSKNTTNLFQHFTTHIEQKKFACKLCDRKFSRGSSLYHHQVIHLGEHRFACNKCDRKFLDAATLCKHKKMHSLGKLFDCDQCDRHGFSRKSLNQHKLIHDEKRFQCQECSRKFANSLSLVRRVHTGYKPFRCDQCERKFSRNSHLVRHKIIHTGDKLFTCDQCDKKFTRNIGVKLHKRSHCKSSSSSYLAV